MTSFPFDTFGDIQFFVFDVDGVMTNTQLLITETGELLRQVSVRDGYAIKRALEAGLEVAIITGGRSEGVRRRFAGLGVELYHAGIHDKLPVLKTLLAETGFTASRTLYLGDDLPDLPCLQHVGLGCAPADACPEVLGAADYISSCPGGGGCVRDVIERVMRLQGTWLA